MGAVGKAVGWGLVGVVAVGVIADKGSDSEKTGASSAPAPSPKTYDQAPAQDAVQPVSSPAAKAPVAASKPTPVDTWLYPASGGDGDSWKDTRGREYRLGLVNTPETGECYSAKATSARKRLVTSGFKAKVYARDTYGRGVSLVTTRSGVNVNVYLARHGFAKDTYLAEFRHENPSLAAQLDGAFAAAKREKVGLWGACVSAPAPAPVQPQPFVAAPASGCHPDYVTCIPVKGDGSGSGAANDLDCGDIGKKVTLRQVGVDPYRLDADSDGLGCDSY